ncbi:MAG: GNAT family N-acetyltransferase [Saprospiraceae bacterium]
MIIENIIQATSNDIPALIQLFKRATDVMISQGIHQWNYTYPLAHHISADVDAGNVYIYWQNDQIVGTITTNEDQDEQYKKIHWHHKVNKAMIIHRLAVNPDFQGLGIGKKLCLFAEQLALSQSIRVMRLDAYSQNPVSIRLYHQLGYHRANGFCYFHKNVIPFYCFDKWLEAGKIEA